MTSAVDSGPLEPVGDGLPPEITGMADTRFVAARGDAVAVGTRAGQVWVRWDEAGWQQLADDLDGITCVALA